MKKLIMFALLVCISISSLGCGGTDSNSKYISEDNNIKLVNISGILSYDIDTRMIYYYFKDRAGYKGYGYMSPYISENGNFCRYDVNERKIIEVKK